MLLKVLAHLLILCYWKYLKKDVFCGVVEILLAADYNHADELTKQLIEYLVAEVELLGPLSAHNECLTEHGRVLFPLL